MIPSRSFSDLYINDFDSVKDFYNLHFTNIFNLSNSYLSTINNNLTKNLINEIRNYNQNINSDKTILDNIDKLNDKKCLTIITGQQPGLLTGPLYTIYKGLTAIKLANHLSKIYHRNVVPIFWVASEDHDFEEVNGIKWITKNNELKEFTFSPKNYKIGLPDYKIKLNGNLDKLFSEISSTIYNTEFKEVILSNLINCLKASKTFDEFFCRVLAIIFQGYGLIILPSHLIEMRKLASPIIQKEIENPLSSTKLVMKSGNEINKKGLKSALKRIGNEVNFFFILDNIRRKVTYNSKGVKIEGINKTYNKEQLIKELNNHPEKFSPNVILRPVIQEFIFPNLAYIAGPGEISYHAQLKEVFKFFNVRFPILYPRKNIIIIEPSISQILKKYNANTEEILKSPKLLSKIIIRKAAPDKEIKELEKSKKILLSTMNELEKKLTPNIKKQVDDIDNFINKGFEKIYNFILDFYKNQNDIVNRQINKLNISLFPDDKPQERVLNIVQFLIKYGNHFIKELFDIIDLRKTDLVIFDIKSIIKSDTKEHEDFH